MGRVTMSPVKYGPTWFKDFHLFEYNKAWRLGSGQGMTREEAKTSSRGQSRKDYRSRIYRSLESFVGGRIRDIDYRLINRTT
ncbi:hypothetical protein Tco_0126647 [Tanacetum coccineum]